VIESRETHQPYGEGRPGAWLLSRDWTIKFAAALVPRGMERDAPFLDALQARP
jgi:hypothetical protein